MRGHPSIVLSYWSHFNIKLLGESCHCFFRKRKSLATTFGRPSRSDLVQLKFYRYKGNNNFQSYGEIESNRRIEVAHALLIKMNHLSFFILTDNVSTFKMKLNSF